MFEYSKKPTEISYDLGAEVSTIIILVSLAETNASAALTQKETFLTSIEKCKRYCTQLNVKCLINYTDFVSIKQLQDNLEMLRRNIQDSFTNSVYVSFEMGLLMGEGFMFCNMGQASQFKTTFDQAIRKLRQNIPYEKEIKALVDSKVKNSISEDDFNVQWPLLQKEVKLALSSDSVPTPNPTPGPRCAIV